MKCTGCDADTHILETRGSDGGASVRRRRECTKCGQRFTTFERRESDPVYVVKRSGERQRFDRDKLRRALLRAAHKRPVSSSDVDAVVDRVEAEAIAAGGDLDARRVGRTCMEALRELDAGAHLQYAGTLPPDEAEFARPVRTGSVRPHREDAELPLKAASRKGTDG